MKHIFTILLVLTVATTAHAYKRTETIREYGANVYCTTCEKVTWHGFKAEGTYYFNNEGMELRVVPSATVTSTDAVFRVPKTPDYSDCDWSLTCSVCGTVIQGDVHTTFKIYSGVEEREVGNVHN